LNLSPNKGIQEVAGTSDLVGIRFTQANDSTLEVGVYGNITLQDVTDNNSGWSDAHGRYYTVNDNGKAKGYSKHVTDKGGSVQLINGMSNEAALDYLGGNEKYGESLIGSGTHLGDVTFLDANALSTLGLDFKGNLSGITSNKTKTFGFSFARSLLPGGELSWIAHIMAECANDTMGMDGTFQAYNPPGGGENTNEGVPEPFSMVAAGLALGAGKLYKSRKK
jgi:hypothetical protein